MSDFNRMVLNPRTLWVTIADEIGDRAARGEAPVEIARVLRVSVAKIRRVLYNLEMEEMACGTLRRTRTSTARMTSASS